MPVTYAHDREGGITNVSCVGLLTVPDLAEHWAGIYSDEKVLASGRVLVDMREAEIGFTGADIVRMASSEWPSDATAVCAMAVVVATPEQFDAARQFQLLAREGCPHQVFFSEQEAREWLERLNV